MRVYEQENNIMFYAIGKEYALLPIELFAGEDSGHFINPQGLNPEGL